MKQTLIRVLDTASDSEIIFELDRAEVFQNQDGADQITLIPKKRNRYPIFDISPLEAKKMNDEEFLNWFNYKMQARF